MKLFIDNDVIMKFAEYELLLFLKEKIQGAGYKIFVLPELPFVLGLRGAGKKKLSPVAINQVVKFLEDICFAEIKTTNVMQEIQKISVNGLDAGEQALLGCLLEADSSLMCSGDKIALNAINKLVGNSVFNLENKEFIIVEQVAKISVNSLAEGVAK